MRTADTVAAGPPQAPPAEGASSGRRARTLAVAAALALATWSVPVGAVTQRTPVESPRPAETGDRQPPAAESHPFSPDRLAQLPSVISGWVRTTVLPVVKQADRTWDQARAAASDVVEEAGQAARTQLERARDEARETAQEAGQTVNRWWTEAAAYLLTLWQQLQKLLGRAL